MSIEKVTGILNDLIIINNDRIEGYETAAKETDEGDLKLIFSRFQQTSRSCRETLVSEVITSGGIPDEGTRLTGKFFRVWMDMKAALTGKDRKVILDSCIYGEEAAAEAYDEVLTKDSGSLSVAQQQLLHAQQLVLKNEYEQVKTMRDLLALESASF